MKSLIGLWKALADDMSALDGVSTIRDQVTASDRVKSEGESFLTLTLPAFGTDFLRCLEEGKVGSGRFLGFKRKGGLPAFLGGFLCRVFDPQSGIILDEPCANSVLAVHSLTGLAKKIEIPLSDRKVEAAMRRFVECEDELKQLEREWTGKEYPEFSRISSLLFGDVFDAVNREVDNFELHPKHGGGSTADRLVGNQKWRFAEWTERMESVFPFREYAGPNLRESTRPSVHLPSRDERPVRVIAVPKTQKAPRIIAMEPTCMQYMQQAVSSTLMSHLERHLMASQAPNGTTRQNLTSQDGGSGGAIPKGSSQIPIPVLGFRDQENNQLLAREGSLHGNLATLDLSEASDRVLNSHVLELFRPWPSLSEAVQACRSRTAVLPSGTKVRLSKFASMGSALCFPVEALVFTTIVMLGIQDARKTRLNSRDLVRLRGKVRVFGDDLIVPADCAAAVVHKLELFGLKVNTDKSFVTGRFRESCGGDFFDGEWVTPIRLKKSVPLSRRDVEEIQHWVEFSNSLHFAGFWKAAEYAAEVIRGVLGEMPVTDVESSALSLKSFLPGTRGRLGWDKHLHKPKIKAWTVQVVTPVNEIDGDAALRKCLLGDWSDPVDKDHLLRSGRPSSVHLKKRWVPS